LALHVGPMAHINVDILDAKTSVQLNCWEMLKVYSTNSSFS